MGKKKRKIRKVRKTNEELGKSRQEQQQEQNTTQPGIPDKLSLLVREGFLSSPK